MRHRTGLRNRYRAGKGSYAKGKKSRAADRYSKFERGEPSGTCCIAGHQIWSVRNDTVQIGLPERRESAEPERSTVDSNPRKRVRHMGPTPRPNPRH